MNLKIDPLFENYIPPLTKDERIRLEENIVRAGVIHDPIKTWNGYIIDGHNRYYIAQTHSEVKYTTMELPFDSRESVLAWICGNQLGRRNLTKAQKKYLIGKQYSFEKCPNGGDRKSDSAKSEGQFAQVIPDDTTAKRIAQAYGINEKTVRRAEMYSKGIDIAEETMPGIREDILTGRITPTQDCLNEILAARGEHRKELVDAMRIQENCSKQKKTTREKGGLHRITPETILERIQNHTFEGALPQDEVSRENYLIALRASRGAIHSLETTFPIDCQIHNLLGELEAAKRMLIYRWSRIAMIYNTVIAEPDAYTGITEMTDELDAYLGAMRDNLRELSADLQRNEETVDRDKEDN